MKNQTRFRRGDLFIQVARTESCFFVRITTFEQDKSW